MLTKRESLLKDNSTNQHVVLEEPAFFEHVLSKPVGELSTK